MDTLNKVRDPVEGLHPGSKSEQNMGEAALLAFAHGHIQRNPEALKSHSPI